MIDSAEPAKPSVKETAGRNSDYLYLPRLELRQGLKENSSFPKVIHHVRAEIRNKYPQENTFQLVDDNRFRIKESVLEAIYQQETNPQINKKTGAGAIPSNLLIYDKSSFSTLVLAEDTLLGRPVVAKFLKTVDFKKIRNLQEVQEDFYKEARVIANLEHPHIAKIYSLTLAPYKDLYFPLMILKKYEHSLAQMMKQSSISLTVEQISKLCSQIASALDYIHEKGVVNCDVKPGNILFDKEGNAVLTDFGIAFGDYRPANNKGRYLDYTPGCVSPEVFNKGKPSAYSDQYTLALIIHYLFGGKIDSGNQFIILPFSDEKFAGVFNVLQKAASILPEDRYTSCTEFSAQLKKALDALPADSKIAFNKEVPDYKTQSAE